MRNKTCTVKLTGGLGNQLFKFANGLRVASHFGSELILETSFYDLVSKKQDYATPREFDLDYFPKIANVRKSKSLNLTLERVRSKFWRESPSSLHHLLGFYTEEDDLKDFSFVSRVEGSFEDLKFFPKFDSLQDYLRFPKSHSAWLTRNIVQINEQQPLSLHVRRTDFLKLPDLYGVVSRNYYLESIRRFKVNFPNQPTWLFSDDPRSALDFLGEDVKIDRILGPEVGIGPGEVLNLLSKSLGICAANSTFSWWAGFLGSFNQTTQYVSIPSSFNTLRSDDPATKLLLPGWMIF